MEAAVPGLRRKVLLDGAGHWIQQERPEKVDAGLLAFLRGLEARWRTWRRRPIFRP